MFLLDFNGYLAFLLACCRLSGMIFFNPIFGRRNVPNMVKIGLALALALYAAYGTAGMAGETLIDLSAIAFLVAMLKEFAVGYAMGFMIQIFMSVLHLGGEISDLQMGLSMAQMYDPNTNAQISITGNLLTAMYTLIFFISNSHLTLLAVAIKSFEAIPMGMVTVNPGVGLHFAELFATILVYALQLAMPILVVEIITEAAVGIMMRVVPNINVFVVNLQLKMMVGLVVLLTIIPVLVRYLEKLNMIMLERLQEVLLFFV